MLYVQYIYLGCKNVLTDDDDNLADICIWLGQIRSIINGRIQILSEMDPIQHHRFEKL
jgi:hypothetical protein